MIFLSFFGLARKRKILPLLVFRKYSYQLKFRELYALVPYQSLSTYNINFGSMLNYNIAKRIQEMFRASEVITVNEEAITPIYKVRENAEKFSIKEVDLKEYLVRFAPRDCKPYIDLLLQKIYHPTEEDNQKDEMLRLSSLR